MERQIISREQAAALLSVSKKTIDRWIRSGRIEAFKAHNSSRVLIYKDSLLEENLKSARPVFENNL